MSDRTEMKRRHRRKRRVIFRDATVNKAGGRGGGGRKRRRREEPLAAEEMSRLGFSEVVNQEHQRVGAFTGELERNKETPCDRLLACEQREGTGNTCTLSQGLSAHTTHAQVH